MEQIVFATDFSAASHKTLAYAAALARKTGGRIIAGYAFKPPTSLYKIPAKELEASAKEHLQRLESFLKSPLCRGLRSEARLAHGSPVRAMGKLALDVKADLILVAKRSRSTLEKFFVGSVTERIAGEAPCPVLVAPDLDAYTTRWKPVLCPVDFSRNSSKALEWAVRLCRKYGGSLAVLHAATLPEDKQERKTALAEAKKQLDEMLQIHDAPPQTSRIIVEGRPSSHILQTAEDLNCDLVVIGRRGMNLADYVGLGSTSLAVLKGETFPLLIVP